MKFGKKAKVGGAVVVGGAMAIVMAVEPTTLLAKCVCVLIGGAVGAAAADPLLKETENLKEKIAGLNAAVEVLAARVVQASAPAG